LSELGCVIAIVVLKERRCGCENHRVGRNNEATKTSSSYESVVLLPQMRTHARTHFLHTYLGQNNKNVLTCSHLSSLSHKSSSCHVPRYSHKFIFKAVFLLQSVCKCVCVKVISQVQLWFGAKIY